MSSDHHQQGQIMAILMNDQGLIVSQNAAEEIFESGVADSGGPIWNRYSVGIEFYSPDLDGGGPRRSQNVPILLSLYTLGPPGSWVEFTGLQLEDAYAPELPYPTVFTPTWNVHSPSDGADDTRPGFRLFER